MGMPVYGFTHLVSGSDLALLMRFPYFAGLQSIWRSEWRKVGDMMTDDGYEIVGRTERVYMPNMETTL